MTQPARGATRFGVLSGYPSPGAAIAMAALGALAALLSLMAGNWWLVLCGVMTVVVGVRWWLDSRSLRTSSPAANGADDTATDGPDGHR